MYNSVSRLLSIFLFDRFFLMRIDYYSYVPQHMQPTAKRIPVCARTCTCAVRVLTVKALPAVCTVRTRTRIDW
jgi:hypothetical protein